MWITDCRKKMKKEKNMNIYDIVIKYNSQIHVLFDLLFLSY